MEANPLTTFYFLLNKTTICRTIIQKRKTCYIYLLHSYFFICYNFKNNSMTSLGFSNTPAWTMGKRSNSTTINNKYTVPGPGNYSLSTASFKKNPGWKIGSGNRNN
jgi:hypothetical protein